MIDSDFRVEFATWSGDQDALRAVRTEVFILEQRVPEAEEWDDLDPRSIHVLARDAEGKPIATGRLTPEKKIGRMAVLRAWRGKGVGEAILRTLIEQARAMHYGEVSLHAQTHALDFYARSGFVAEGEEFLECEIPHRVMRLTFAAPTPAPRAGDRLVETPTPRLVAVDSLATGIVECDGLLAAARHKLWIYSRDLDQALLDREPVFEAFKRLAFSGRGAEIRIIVQDPVTPVRDGNRLLHLAQRLSSFISLRTPTVEEDFQYAHAFVLNDVGGYYFRPLGSRFDGEVNAHGPGRHAALLRYFEQVWERAEPHPELRRVSL